MKSEELSALKHKLEVLDARRVQLLEQSVYLAEMIWAIINNLDKAPYWKTKKYPGGRNSILIHLESIVLNIWNEMGEYVPYRAAFQSKLIFTVHRISDKKQIANCHYVTFDRNKFQVEVLPDDFIVFDPWVKEIEGLYETIVSHRREQEYAVFSQRLAWLESIGITE